MINANDLLKGIPDAPLNTAQEQLLGRVLAGKTTTATEQSAAREMLILHAMRESFFYARRCCRHQLPDDEIFSLSYTALCRAVKNFKPGQIRFFAYAKVYVRGEICKMWKAKDVVKNSSSHESLSMDDTVNNWMHHPDWDDGAHEGMTPVRRALSLNCNESSAKLVPDSVEADYDGMHIREMWDKLAPLFETHLNKRERTVLRMRYYDGLNQREIGDKLGVSRAAIQINHANALRKLRCALVEKGELL